MKTSLKIEQFRKHPEAKRSAYTFSVWNLFPKFGNKLRSLSAIAKFATTETDNQTVLEVRFEGK